jgi:hypothetical protein
MGFTLVVVAPKPGTTRMAITVQNADPAKEEKLK